MQATGGVIHVFFFRDGDNITVPAAGGNVAGASSRNNRPDATDPLYIDLGAIADWDDSGIKATYDKIMGPNPAAPGTLMTISKVKKSIEGNLKFTTEEIAALAFEILYQVSAELSSAGGAFTPLSAPAKQGWLHREFYDQNNNLIHTMDTYVHLQISGGFLSKEGAAIKPQWEAEILGALQNTGLLNNS